MFNFFILTLYLHFFKHNNFKYKLRILDLNKHKNIHFFKTIFILIIHFTSLKLLLLLLTELKTTRNVHYICKP